MKATVTLICSKCGKQFVMEKGVETEEKKRSWEQWAKDTYKSPYCPECRKQPEFNVNTIRY